MMDSSAFQTQTATSSDESTENVDLTDESDNSATALLREKPLPSLEDAPDYEQLHDIKDDSPLSTMSVRRVPVDTLINAQDHEPRGRHVRREIEEWRTSLATVPESPDEGELPCVYIPDRRV